MGDSGPDGQQIQLLTNKACKPRAIPTSENLVALGKTCYRKRALTPWVSHVGGARVSRQQAQYEWNRACREPGYWNATTDRPTKLFHDFRRTAYRNMIDAGVDSVRAIDITGHTTTSMAKRYASRSNKAIALAMAQTQSSSRDTAAGKTEGGQKRAWNNDRGLAK